MDEAEVPVQDERSVPPDPGRVAANLVGKLAQSEHVGAVLAAKLDEVYDELARERRRADEAEDRALRAERALEDEEEDDAGPRPQD